MTGRALHSSAPGPTGVFSRVSCVIFDFDGVIADSEPLSLSTLRQALAAFGIDQSLDEVRNTFLGKSLATIEDYVAEHSSAGSTAGFGETWQSALFAAFRKELTALPHLAPLLDGLTGAGIRYCVASSSSIERLDVALAAMNLAHRFPNVFSAEQVSRGKPAPDLFLFAAEQMQSPADQCLVIEDSPYGIRAAVAAGIASVGFVGGSHLRGIAAEHAERLSAEGAEAVFDSLAALAAALDLPGQRDPASPGLAKR